MRLIDLKKVNVIAGASSDKYNSSTSAFQAQVWITERKTDGSHLPAMIWLEFPDPVLPAKISFKPRNIDVKAKIMTPSEFQFIGSHG